jgi:hypothetical protein
MIKYSKKKRKRKNLKAFTILPVDVACSLYIRANQDWRCVRCYKRYAPFHKLVGHQEIGHNCQQLSVSHYFSRGKWSVRFDERNLDSLCILPCHVKWESEERDIYKEYMVKKLGDENKFRGLQIDANNINLGRENRRKQDEFIIMFLTELRNKFKYNIDWFINQYPVSEFVRKAVLK